jgi:hypothetical protein
MTETKYTACHTTVCVVHIKQCYMRVSDTYGEGHQTAARMSSTKGTFMSKMCDYVCMAASMHLNTYVYGCI